MTKLNEHARRILKPKYYAADEKDPDDLFSRIARVCSMPDVLDAMITKKDEGKIHAPTELRKVFSQYEEVYERLLKRRHILGVSETQRDKIDAVEEAAHKLWREATKKYFDAMSNLDFMPGTPTLINAGRTGMLSSCFFIRVGDSMEGIFDTVKQVALISKAGGGVGLDLSDLRPSGAPVGTTAGTSSGPVSFMEVFDATGETVKQGGVRRAALLAALRVDHPDILKFISCKATEGDFTNFNISVLINDKFIEAVEDNDVIELWHNKSQERSKIEARKIWDKLIEFMHKNGEPGVIFMDTVRRGDIFSGKFGELGPNPCGEQLLIDYESCNLGAINLGNFVTDISADGGECIIDRARLEKTVRLGIRFLDNVVDINKYPLPEITDVTLMTRKIGLGFMGLHDLLLKLKIAYGSEECFGFLDSILADIRKWANDESVKLGEQRGIPKVLKEIGVNRRNSGILTCQPTGTVSLICNQASSGIEPVFEWEYTRQDTHGTHNVVHFIKETFGENPPPYAKTAAEIPPESHVKVQAKIQSHIDSSISKTLILPKAAELDDVAKIIKLAHSEGCKSITIYRKGSRQKEVLVSKENVQSNDPVKLKPRGRPRVLFGATYKSPTPAGKAYITVNEDKEGTREVFIHISKAGSEIGSHVEAEGRLISNSLKFRIPVESVVGHLKNQKSNPVWEHGRSVKSVPDAVAKVVEDYISNYEGFSDFIPDEFTAEEVKEDDIPMSELSGELCPECGEVLYIEGGCDVCKSCGYGSCG